jgi:AcrR family transcriptional regulator
MRQDSQKSTPPAAASREPKRERGRQRVAGLLDAAMQVFAERGYAAATMTEIAARAGASIGSLYQFFPNKDQLATALLARYGEQVDAALAELHARAAALGSAAIAEALIGLQLARVDERAVALALTDVGQEGAGQREALRDTMRARIAEILCLADPRLDRTEAAARAVVILHLMKAVPAVAAEQGERSAAMQALLAAVQGLVGARIA